MRRLALGAILVTFIASLSFAQEHKRTFRGQIMDSMCAEMGSHDPGGYNMTHTHTPKDCTLACVKSGSKFVLYNRARKSTVQLDDQEKAREFAGQNVQVTGPYDPKTKSMHVDTIKAGS